MSQRLLGSEENARRERQVRKFEMADSNLLTTTIQYMTMKAKKHVLSATTFTKRANSESFECALMMRIIQGMILFAVINASDGFMLIEIILPRKN